MNRRLAETILEYLSFSDTGGKAGSAFANFKLRHWEDTLRWLDNTNLALYLLKKLRDRGDDRYLPPPVLLHLEQNYSNNQLRVEQMVSQFSLVNERFRQAGVHFAAVKGFSLVPEFCPDAGLRQQSDLDYMIDEQSFPAAERALGELGYFLKSHPIDVQWIFWKGPLPLSTATGAQYHPREGYVIELHLAIWDPDGLGIAIPDMRFSEARTTEHEWRGMRFPVLRDEDAFLLQVLHVLTHLLCGWVRMFWFYEIAYCLQRRANDEVFWQGVERYCQGDAALPEFVAIVAGLAAQFFHAPLPAIVQTWKADLRPSVRIWLDNYSQRLPFQRMPVYEMTPFPQAKLILFLHRQFLQEEQSRKHFTRRQLIPWEGTARVARGFQEQRIAFFSLQWRRRMLLTCRRFIYHVGAGLRYLCELPRWLWLNRRRTA